ncbi:DASS family sodium-coupled anion symporter [Corynebacterium frankenforstense]|uniref:DASS family sodium-coupled anion symporter n=1 Tax=Corynebacterium frankenforstense TaxID=1230998 RepID=UPI0026ED236D|nr:DASS family sodium-coupled anion symporter [Corynebacterium frankenforstense]
MKNGEPGATGTGATGTGADPAAGAAGATGATGAAAPSATQPPTAGDAGVGKHTATKQSEGTVGAPGRAHWVDMAWRFGVPLAIFAGLWFCPHPETLSDQAWRMFGLFVATIVAIILKPMPMGAVTIIGMVIGVLTGLIPLTASKDDPGAAYALMGFGNGTIWLIVMAFLISRGFVKTGLGRRIALFFVSKVGGKMMGVSYGLAMADFVLSPAIPSATARGGGIMAPIMKSVALTYESEPGPTRRRAGAFLAMNVGQVNAITCAIFLTAMAGNPLIASLAGQLSVEITWTNWALGAIVPGIVALIVVPYVVYLVYPPELKETPKVKTMAQGELRNLGPLSYGEKVLAGTFVVLLLLWTLGDLLLGISATTTAFVGVIILLITSVLTWEDVIREKAAWDTMVWFAVLYMMATALSKFGFIDWISELIASGLGGMHWGLALVLLVVIYFFSHYLFASATAHISAMYIAFLGAAIALGAPPLMSALVLAYTSNLFTSLTQYAGGASPTLFGMNYIRVGEWWRTAAIAGVASLTIWIVVGGAWMNLIGFW